MAVVQCPPRVMSASDNVRLIQHRRSGTPESYGGGSGYGGLPELPDARMDYRPMPEYGSSRRSGGSEMAASRLCVGPVYEHHRPVTINDILADERTPNRFFVEAMIKDFLPTNVRRVAIPKCATCMDELVSKDSAAPMALNLISSSR